MREPKELSDWRGEVLARDRVFVKQADSEVLEEFNRRGFPVGDYVMVTDTGPHAFRLVEGAD